MSAFDSLGVTLALNNLAFRDIEVSRISIGINSIDYKAYAQYVAKLVEVGVFSRAKAIGYRFACVMV